MPLRHLAHALLAVSLMLFGPATPAAGFLEKEIHFSEADVQAQIDRNGSLKKSYGSGTIVITLDESPKIRLGEPAGQTTVTARLRVSLLGQPAVPVDMLGTSGLRYDDGTKAFFLDRPVVQSIQSAALSRDYEPIARQAITQMMASYFRNRPVYVLREDGSLQEQAARWLLRSIRIEPGQVIAVLSPV
ncbi:MAG: DUF1439 domain-containing protein [Dechloromonas agitata]|uniref:DUF1439 domain-containing protein n=1 Tax=Dechloromonas agitata TaxID=73030 RepID=A0A930FY72_9RHOO|nr:DUF1439 domain-containing protein [Dechloromonas agitata]MBF1163756.1 DUF1439 domain-containing protein [Dechloromonas agitata]